MNKYLINLIKENDVEGLQYVTDYFESEDSPLHFFVRRWHIGNGDMQCRRNQLQSVINRINDLENNEDQILLHFLGHGVRDGIGIEFISYNFLNDLLMPLAERHQLYINMMNTCYSSGMLGKECYKALMYTEGEVNDIYSPFRIYENEDNIKNEESFENFTQIFQVPNLRINIRVE